MKHSFLVFASASWIALNLSAAGAESGDTPNGQLVTAKISSVTVYADRAQVTRSARVHVSTGVAHHAFAKLPGWIDEGSVRVTLLPPGAGQVLDVEIERTYLAKASDEDFRKAQDRVQETTDQIAALDDEKSVLEAETKQVETIRAFSLDKWPKEAAVRAIQTNEYEASIDFIANAQRKILKAKRELERSKRELQPELNVRQRQLDELRQRSQLEQRTVKVAVQGAGDQEADLVMTCMLPGATWEPVHELRASPGAPTVALSSYAVVMQTTGEDWTGASLALSSQRSTETLKIPELEALLVGSGRKLARVVSGATDSFGAANSRFAAQNLFFNDLLNPEAARQQEYRRNQAIIVDNTKRVDRIFETLKDRGTTAHFAALGAQTIRTDGRAVRVPIGVIDLAAQYRIIAAPEVSLNAVRTVDLSNAGRQSLLPGKVSIYLGGAFLGMTETDFVAPSESFALYLGVADALKLSRTLDKKRSELKRSGQRTRMQVSFLVAVENLTDASVAAQLLDRVPVSETDEIRVSAVKVLPEGKPDNKGLLRWDLNLAPKQSKEYRLEYMLDYPTDLPSRREPPAAGFPMSSPGPSSAIGAPAAPLPDQIRKMERFF